MVLARCSTRSFSIITLRSFKQVQHALDQTNEEKMIKTSSIQQEVDVQNTAVIACFGIWSPKM